MGEMIVNGGMELFADDLPTGWTPGLVSQVTQQGRVHSGLSAVNIEEGGNLSQTVAINGGCFYSLSLFAHGEGAQVGFTATVTFLSPSSPGLQISVRQQDVPTGDREFSYYRAITITAPLTATQALIQFSVTGEGGQSLDLDDVSFTVQ